MQWKSLHSHLKWATGVACESELSEVVGNTYAAKGERAEGETGIHREWQGRDTPRMPEGGE